MDMVRERRRTPRGVATLYLEDEEWFALTHARRRAWWTQAAILALVLASLGVSVWALLLVSEVRTEVRSVREHLEK